MLSDLGLKKTTPTKIEIIRLQLIFVGKCLVVPWKRNAIHYAS